MPIICNSFVANHKHIYFNNECDSHNEFHDTLLSVANSPNVSLSLTSTESCGSWCSEEFETSASQKSVRFSEELIQTFVIPSRKQEKKASHIRFSRNVQVKYISPKSDFSYLFQDLWYNNDDFEVFAAFSDTEEALNEIIECSIQDDYDKQNAIEMLLHETIHPEIKSFDSVSSSTPSRICRNLPSICSTSRKQAPLKLKSASPNSNTINTAFPSILK